jgi:hypothetical protein
MRSYAIIFAMLLGLPLLANAQATGTTSVTVTIGAEATISITNGTTNLAAGTAFGNFTGATNFTYQIRTSQAAGTGSVTLRVTSDFSPAGGPSVASPPSPGDKLTYTCSGSGPSTPSACASAQTASTSTSTPVLSFGADAHSNSSPGDSGSVSWTLVNDPKYKTGAYAATVTFTISAT